MIGVARSLHLTIAVGALCACNNLPGRPKPGPEVPRPQQVLDFAILYSQNCAGCHGANGQLGPATPLANPEYQALIDDTTLSDIIAKGQKGTMMPAFAESAGGSLSDAQVDSIVKGVRSNWSKGNVLQGLNAPPYKSDGPGDSARGKQIYGEQCARCHGEVGGPPGPKGAILNGSFLALVSDQTIRTTAIVGRPDLGMPNWRNRIPGKVMTDQELNDVVTFVMSQRPATPGQPYGPLQQRTQRTSAATNPTPAKTGGR
jgi:cytochrome c oxidase cbb3-type subunit 3/ubiquinol-cytochrome c reductase cytochrome c subunit